MSFAFGEGSWLVLPSPFQSLTHPRVGRVADWLPRGCTFIYRVTGLRAVEDFIVEGLRTHMGRTLSFRHLGLGFPSLTVVTV